MGILSFLFHSVTWWDRGTVNTMLYTRRKGVKVGEDDQGNVFYETKDGKRRWVIFNGEVEGSRIDPNWHGWLHHTFDEPPTKRPLAHKPWEKPHHENLTGTPLAYAPPGSILRPEPASFKDYESWNPDDSRETA